jgi:hypothetical protein
MATDKPRSIVTYVHRPKRAPRKTAKAAVITGPTIVTAKSKRTYRQVAIWWRRKNRRGSSPRRTRIVAAGSGTCPILTPEEHKRRGDGADALFRELVRLATGQR